MRYVATFLNTTPILIMFIAVMLLHVQYQLELPTSIDAEVSKQQWPFQSSSGQLVDPSQGKGTCEVDAEQDKPLTSLQLPTIRS